MKPLLFTVFVAALAALATPGARANLAVTQTLTAGAQAETGSEFGSHVTTHGEWLFVGQPRATTGGNVHVFRRQPDGTWARTQLLNLPVSVDHAADSRFGIAIEIEGDTAAVGASFSGAERDGRVYIYRLIGSQWELNQTIADVLFQAEPRDPLQNFGYALALSGDLLLISSPTAVNDRGQVMIARRALDGQWSIRPKGNPDSESLDASFNHPSLLFGRSIDLVGRYSLATSRESGDDPDVFNRGVFAGGDGFGDPPKMSTLIPEPPPQNGLGPIQPEPTLVPTATLQIFRLVRMSSDAAGVVAFSSSAGSRIIPLTRENTNWTYGQPTDFSQISTFTALDVSGTRLLAGASAERVAIILNLINGVWTESQRLNSPRASNDAFGAAVAISGSEFVVGAPEANSQGAVEIFSVPIPSPPTLAAKGKTKFKTSRPRVVLNGTAADATRVEFKAGKGGFKKAKGSPTRWRIPVRLTSNRTVVKIRATGPGGKSKILKFTVTRK